MITPQTWLAHFAQTLGIRKKIMERTDRKTSAFPGLP